AGKAEVDVVACRLVGLGRACRQAILTSQDERLGIEQDIHVYSSNPSAGASKPGKNSMSLAKPSGRTFLRFVNGTTFATGTPRLSSTISAPACTCATISESFVLASYML